MLFNLYKVKSVSQLVARVWGWAQSVSRPQQWSGRIRTWSLLKRNMKIIHVSATDWDWMLIRLHGCSMRHFLLRDSSVLCWSAGTNGGVGGGSHQCTTTSFPCSVVFSSPRTVPAPDVRYRLQLGLDQQGQMLRPPVYGKRILHLHETWTLNVLELNAPRVYELDQNLQPLL